MAERNSIHPLIVCFKSLPGPIQMAHLSVKRTGCYKASSWLLHWMAHWHTSRTHWMICTTWAEWRMGRCFLPLFCCGKQKLFDLMMVSGIFLFFPKANWRLKWPSVPHNCDGWTACLIQLHLLFFQECKKRSGQYNLSEVLRNFRLTSDSWLQMLVVDINSLDAEFNTVLSVQLGS